MKNLVLTGPDPKESSKHFKDWNQQWRINVKSILIINVIFLLIIIKH